MSSSDVKPARLREAQAGPYLGYSKHWLRKMRTADRQRIAQGGKPVGPAWHYDNKTPFYSIAELDRYIEKREAETSLK